jgi:hypothetical protein
MNSHLLSTITNTEILKIVVHERETLFSQLTEYSALTQPEVTLQHTA